MADSDISEPKRQRSEIDLGGDEIIEDGVIEQLDDAADSETAEHIALKVGNNLTFRRVDQYLQGRFRQFSRTTIQKLVKEQAVKVNQKYAKPSTKLSSGDIVDVILPPPEIREITPENIPLDIVYEDDDMIVINKQANLIVHPARGQKSGTLVNALVYYAKNLSNGSEDFRPGIVHRLDRNTTGILVIAKNDTAHWRLAAQFEKRLTKKYYLAIVHGTPELTSDRINQPLGVHPTMRVKYAVRPDTGKEAITFYEALEKFKGYSLLKVNIKTGRTHQIRVHLAYIHHPIVGDDMYGGKIVYQWQLENKEPIPQEPVMARPALHSWRLEIAHPTTNENMVFEAPLPKDMQNMLEELRKYRV
jgi:23S rRNA pseudouridine1911/1915/1917 synthase